jgi:hypothetical protein
MRFLPLQSVSDPAFKLHYDSPHSRAALVTDRLTAPVLSTFGSVICGVKTGVDITRLHQRTNTATFRVTVHPSSLDTDVSIDSVSKMVDKFSRQTHDQGLGIFTLYAV